MKNDIGFIKSNAVMGSALVLALGLSGCGGSAVDADNPAASVSAVSCANLVAGEPMSCTVTGANLPATGLALAATGCNNPQQLAGATATQVVLTCVPAAAGPLATSVMLNGASLNSTSVTVPTTTEIAQAFLTADDAKFATAIPVDGAARYASSDGCSLHSGYTKAASIAGYEANLDPSVGSDAQKTRIGSTQTNATVLAERAITNADNTTRRELDIQYQVNYADGTVASGVKNTLIYGSSSGSILATGPCTTSENQTAWRSYGNRALVNVGVDTFNTRNELYSVTSGAPLSTAVTHGASVRFGVRDPAGAATYAIVSGSGITTASGELKLISARLLRDDSLLAGKNNNYVNYTDVDLFGVCRTSTGAFADAPAADCAQFGAAGNEWGVTNANSATVDTTFATYGFVAGGEYTFRIYNDNGWKTVNGQSGMTPIATYTATLKRLPYSAATLAGTTPATGLYSTASNPTLTMPALATALTGMGAISFSVDWSTLGALPDATKFSRFMGFSYAQGNTATTVGNGFPKVRQIAYAYPPVSDTTLAFSLPATTSDMINRNYGQFSTWHTDRNSSWIRSYLILQ